MEEYQGVLTQKDEMIRALSRKVKALEGELSMHRGQKRRGLTDGKHPPRLMSRNLPELTVA